MNDYAKTFGSELFGFNRRDVIACVKELASELDELRAQLAEKSELLLKLTEENARLAASGSEASAEAENKIAELSAELAFARDALDLFKPAELGPTAEKLREIEKQHSETGGELRRLLETLQRQQ
jgi:chromosome segregation ATPase